MSWDRVELYITSHDFKNNSHLMLKKSQLITGPLRMITLEIY